MKEFKSAAFQTKNGTPYLKAPGVALIASPHVDLGAAFPFMADFDEALGFEDYFRDGPFELPAEMLVKFAGQLCYMSFGPTRTKNSEMKKYLDNIKRSGHGSVFEHANFTFLFYGIDRAVTHELVRHRAGFAYSQCSQRYVDGKVLRFVERPEFQDDEMSHHEFEKRIDQVAGWYNWQAEHLRLAGLKDPAFAEQPKRDQRKQVNQAARACLPNETEAPIVVTANVRAWRHFLEMRASQHADRTICELAFRTGTILKHAAPILFDDFEPHKDGERWFFRNEFRKV